METSLELHFKEWYDKVNGNSYFAGKIIIDDYMKIHMPFQYGYGTAFVHETKEALKELGIMPKDYIGSLRQYCLDKRISYIESMKQGCKKRELMAYAKKI